MTHLSRIALALGILAAPLLVGCTMDTDIGSHGLWIDSDDCLPIQCGHNDDAINEEGFGQVRTDGIPNPQDVTLVGVKTPNGIMHKLDAINGRLVGRNPITGEVSISAPALLGSSIILDRLEGPVGAKQSVRYEMTIARADVSNAPLPSDWTDMGRDLWEYHFTVIGPHSTTPTPLCKGELEGERNALVTKGEYYNPHTATMNAGSIWLNIACGTHGLNKMIRLGYAQEISTPGDITTTEQREATLRMIRADYLGDGIAYTESGTLIWWQNKEEWVVVGTPDTMSTTAVREAYWTAEGAVCLDTYRVPALIPADFPSLQTCDGFDPTTDEWEWVTYVEP